MRLFFALELPGELAIQISDWRDKQLPRLGRPVPAANFHLTLAFLGHISKDRLEQLCLDTDARLSRRPLSGGTLELDQIGYWQKPGVFWLGPSTWPSCLEELARVLQNRGMALGAKRKRSKYQPHLTLFRGCQQPPPAPTLAPEFSWAYKRFALMESRPGSQGVSYHPLAEWKLSPQ